MPTPTSACYGNGPNIWDLIGNLECRRPLSAQHGSWGSARSQRSLSRRPAASTKSWKLVNARAGEDAGIAAVRSYCRWCRSRTAGDLRRYAARVEADCWKDCCPGRPRAKWVLDVLIVRGASLASDGRYLSARPLPPKRKWRCRTSMINDYAADCGSVAAPSADG